MDIRSRGIKGNTYTPEQVRRVIERSGLSVESEVDSDYIVFCPFHSNFRTPAGEVDKIKGTFFCFSCRHICSLEELVMHQTRKSYFETLRFIKSLESQVDIMAEVSKKLVPKEQYTPFDELMIKRLSTAALQSDRALTYFSGRGITEASIKKFDLGYSEKQDMVTVPVHSPDGILIGFVGRSVEGKEFKNTPGLPKSKTLFNLNRVKSSKNVYVVESSFDAIRLDQCGLSAVATLGANVSNFQIDLLKRYFNDIIIIADNDDAGGNMVKRLQQNLSYRLSVINLDKKYKDIGDMEDEDIVKLNASFSDSIAAILV